MAIARDPYQAVPLSGTWSGFPSSDLGMEVSVDVAVEPPSITGTPNKGETPC